MKKLNKTIYILTDGNYLHVDNETIAIKNSNGNTVHVPPHNIEQIICFGNTTISTPFIAFCDKNDISLSFHSENGYFYGRFYGRTRGNVLLRKAQYMNLDSEKSKDIVRNILIGKIGNSKFLIQKNATNAKNEKQIKLKHTAELLQNQIMQLPDIYDIDSMRGLEGNAASTYFSAFDSMLKTDDKDMLFVNRSKRPPQNKCNALLSFLYTLLKNDVQSALESVGLDISVGYLHTLRPGRPSLALDMMEELRAVLCDRLCISMINLKQIQSKDFDIIDGEIKLKDAAKTLVVDTWQTRKKEEIMHPFLQEKIPIGLIPYSQALLLARVLREDLEQYPPFIWRL